MYEKRYFQKFIQLIIIGINVNNNFLHGLTLKLN